MPPYNEQKAKQWVYRLLKSEKERKTFLEYFQTSMLILTSESVDKEKKDRAFKYALFFLYERGIIFNQPYTDEQIVEIFKILHERIKANM